MALTEEFAALVGDGQPLPAGVHHLASPLVLGPTDRFATTVLRGAGKPYNGQIGTWPNSTTLVADFDDAPLVTMTAGRNSVVRDLGLVGRLSIYGQMPLLETPNREDWPGTFRQHSPHAGLVIDKLGWPFSEHTLIRDVEIMGFYLAFGTKVDGDGGNGDWNTLSRCRFAGNVVAVDITHPQCRGLKVEGGETIYAHTFLTNRMHGAANGRCGGTISGHGFNGVYQLCDLNQASAGSVRFTDTPYGEMIGWFGKFDSGSNRAAVRTTFVDGDYSFNLPCQPGLLAEGGRILLDGGTIQTADIPVFASEVEVRGTLFRAERYEDGTEYGLGRRRAANYFPILDLPHPDKAGANWEDIGSSAYFPNLDYPARWPEQYQIQMNGPRRARYYQPWEKEYVIYDPATETMTFPSGVLPEVGNIVQDDVGLAAWIATEVVERQMKLERINRREVGVGGHFYLVSF